MKVFCVAKPVAARKVVPRKLSCNECRYSKMINNVQVCTFFSQVPVVVCRSDLCGDDGEYFKFKPVAK